MLKYATKVFDDGRPSQPENPIFTISSVIVLGGVLGRNSLSPVPQNKEAYFDNSLNNIKVLEHHQLQWIITELIPLGVRLSDNPEIKLCDYTYEDDFIRDTPYSDLLFSSWVDTFAQFPAHVWPNAFLQSRSAFIAVAGEKSAHCVSAEDVPLVEYDQITPEKGQKRIFVSAEGQSLFVRKDIGLQLLR